LLRQNSEAAALQSRGVPYDKIAPTPFRWILVPLRVLLVSFLLTLLSFAVCLLVGILGVLISAGLRGVQPNMTIAYREIALPAALLAGAVALVVAIVMEVRHRRREREELGSM
jgi:hypothetical protein